MNVDSDTATMHDVGHISWKNSRILARIGGQMANLTHLDLVTLTRRSFIARAAAAVAALVGMPAAARATWLGTGVSNGASAEGKQFATRVVDLSRDPMPHATAALQRQGFVFNGDIRGSGGSGFVSPREKHRRELAESWGREWDRVAFEALTGTESL